jgi:1D-myo-inositol-tetrakisphosphate 5-kinase/inositol-polyphosphate multikinase
MVENGEKIEHNDAATPVIAHQDSVSDETPAHSVSLPTNCLPLAHQVAGHFYGKGRTKLGLLQTGDGLVLKPVQSPPRGEREHNFFKRIFHADDAELNEDEIELRKHLPTYRGSMVHNESNNSL